ncbi:class I SAM-dependent methyltransferase [Halorarum salinum]|uniref:Class I SAM-dependent methyltransferase n=1 Tax=Halorarum salinum TaxID=2743089 RepID=A0A7D5LDP1_9EURY|nr:class I SAM-dependent methyltransferase [Halobaculum salinum]QLG64134.1 class I SAM-dependent methyltransferase [Halobaculum salinum]
MVSSRTRADERGTGVGDTADYRREDAVRRYVTLRAGGLFEQERRALERGFFDPDAPVLDLGCGAGRTTVALVERGYDVVALDRSGPMIRETAAAVDAPCIRGDATRIPVPDGRFGTVLFSYNGLDDLYPEGKRHAALGEINRVLADDGRFVFSAHNSRRQFLIHPPTASEFLGALGFWARNAADGLVGTPYKRFTNSDETYLAYQTTPRAQRRQLRAFGFEPIATIGKSGALSRAFGPTVYYVARKRGPSTAGRRGDDDSARPGRGDGGR